MKLVEVARRIGEGIASHKNRLILTAADLLSLGVVSMTNPIPVDASQQTFPLTVFVRKDVNGNGGPDEGDEPIVYALVDTIFEDGSHLRGLTDSNGRVDFLSYSKQGVYIQLSYLQNRVQYLCREGANVTNCSTNITLGNTTEFNFNVEELDNNQYFPSISR